MDQNHVLQALKDKYGVSDAEAQQILGVLVAAEHQKQSGAGGSITGMRGAATPRGNDFMDIVGGLLGGTAQGGNQGGGDLMGMLGGLLGGGQSGQGGGADIMGIVTDLIGGATNHPNQGGSGADLMGILGGLLGGNAPQVPTQGGGNELMGLLGGLLGGAGGQAGQGGGDDLMGVLGGLLGGMGGGMPSPTPSSGHPSQLPPNNPPNPGKKDMGSIADMIKPSNPKPQKSIGKAGLPKKPPLPGAKGKSDNKTSQ